MQSKFSNRQRRLSSRGVELFFDTDYDKAKAKLLGLLAPSFAGKGGLQKAASPWQRAVSAAAAGNGQTLTWSQMSKNMYNRNRCVTKDQKPELSFWEAPASEMPGQTICMPCEVKPTRTATPSSKVRRYVTHLSKLAPSRASGGPVGLAALAVSGVSDKKSLRAAKKERSKKWHDILMLSNPRPEPGTKAKPARIEIMDPENNVEYNARALRVLLDDEVAKAQTIGNNIRRLTELTRHSEFRKAAERVGVDLATIWPRDVSSFGNQRQSGVRIVSLEDQQSSQRWEAYLKWEIARLKRLALVMVEARSINRSQEQLLRIAADRSRDRANRELVKKQSLDGSLFGYGSGQGDAQQAITMAGHQASEWVGTSESKDGMSSFDGGDRDSSDPVSSAAIEQRIRSTLMTATRHAPRGAMYDSEPSNRCRDNSESIGHEKAPASLSERFRAGWASPDGNDDDDGSGGGDDGDVEHGHHDAGRPGRFSTHPSGGARIPFGGTTQRQRPPPAPARRVDTPEAAIKCSELVIGTGSAPCEGQAPSIPNATATSSQRSSCMAASDGRRLFPAPEPPVKPHAPPPLGKATGLPSCTAAVRRRSPGLPAQRNVRVLGAGSQHAALPRPQPAVPERVPVLELPKDFAMRFRNDSPGTSVTAARANNKDQCAEVTATAAHMAHAPFAGDALLCPSTAADADSKRYSRAILVPQASGATTLGFRSRSVTDPSVEQRRETYALRSASPPCGLEAPASKTVSPRPGTRGGGTDASAMERLQNHVVRATGLQRSRSPLLHTKLRALPNTSSTTGLAGLVVLPGIQDATSTKQLGPHIHISTTEAANTSDVRHWQPQQRSVNGRGNHPSRSGKLWNSATIARSHKSSTATSASYRGLNSRMETLGGMQMAPGFGMAALHTQISPFRVLSRHARSAARGGSAVLRTDSGALQGSLFGTGGLSRL